MYPLILKVSLVDTQEHGVFCPPRPRSAAIWSFSTCSGSKPGFRSHIVVGVTMLPHSRVLVSTPALSLSLPLPREGGLTTPAGAGELAHVPGTWEQLSNVVRSHSEVLFEKERGPFVEERLITSFWVFLLIKLGTSTQFVFRRCGEEQQ